MKYFSKNHYFFNVKILKILTILYVFPLYSNVAFSECIVSNVEAESREPITFFPFERKDPQTGRIFLPEDIVQTITDGEDEIKITAKKYFDELDKIERELNRKGYSIKTGGSQTLGELKTCAEKLEKQSEKIAKMIRDRYLDAIVKDQDIKAALLKWKDDYTKQLPTYEELFTYVSDHEDYNLNMPEVPLFTATRPKVQRKPLEIKKEKSWPWEGGDKNQLWVKVNPYMKFSSNKAEAEAVGSLDIDAALFGVWEGSLVKASVVGSSPGSNAMKLDYSYEVIGLVKDSDTITGNDSLSRKYQEDKSFVKKYTYPFQIGPIPMIAEVGTKGSAGFSWGYELYPLQVGASAGAYAGVLAYGQLAVGIAQISAGIGGSVDLIKLQLSLKGTGALTFNEEPQVDFELTGTADATFLSGSIYAFAEVDYLFGTKTFDKSLFQWDGFKKSGNIFDFKASYNRHGIIAEGDITPEDVIENSHINRIANLEKMEEKVVQDSFTTAEAVIAGLKKFENQNIDSRSTLLLYQNDTLRDQIDDFNQELSEWVR